MVQLMGKHSFFLISALLATNIHLVVLLCRILEKVNLPVSQSTHELFLHEEMMGIKGNTQSIKNWTSKLEPWTLRKN